MRKHVQKRTLKVWPSGYLIRRWVCLGTMDLISHCSRKLLISAKEEGDWSVGKTSWISQDKFIELFASELALVFKTMKEWLWRQPSGMPLWFQNRETITLLSISFRRSASLQRPGGSELPGLDSHPSRPVRHNIEPKMRLMVRYSLPARFGACLGTVTPACFLVSPPWNGNIYPMPVSPLYFGKKCNLFGFKGSQLEGNFASGWMCLEFHPCLI